MSPDVQLSGNSYICQLHMTSTGSVTNKKVSNLTNGDIFWLLLRRIYQRSIDLVKIGSFIF